MFVQNSPLRGSGSEPNKTGRQSKVRRACVAPMMKIGFAERSVSFFWKTSKVGWRRF